MLESREVGRESVLDLYTGCIPPGAEEPGRESGEHFLGKRVKGWRGFVACEDGRPVGRVEDLERIIRECLERKGLA